MSMFTNQLKQDITITITSINSCFLIKHTKTIVRDSPLMGKNLIHIR